MRVLITGSSGMLGSDILPILGREFDVVAPSHGEMDITDFERVRRAIAEGGFDWVIHLAAITDLDWCEDNPEKAFLVNALATKNIAEICRDTGTKLAYISTSGVFSGQKKTPYTERDIPKPANVYGKSKYEGEKFVQEVLDEGDFLILRVGWLFGSGARDKKFVGKMFDLLRERPKVMAVDDIFGSPNYSIDIGEAIVQLIKGGHSGIFHIANSGEPASRYDIAVAIREFMGSAAEIEPVPASKFPTRAFRPPMEAIDSIRIEDALGKKLRHWRRALEEYVKRLLMER
ncbi:dTDP-4-dehydrorhamnose reductase [bacterium]|nr:dTDP-4-dehydrorhamnose reductase [bacterium]